MDQKSKWRLHLRHCVIIAIAFSVIVLICAAIWFGTYKMPTTLAYLTPTKVSQRISMVSSQSIPATNSQSVSEAGTQISSDIPQNSSISSVSSSTGPAYQQSYPNLYVPSVEKAPRKAGDKVVYLSFDDGPSELTEPLLNVLDQYDVKATFFVMAQGKSKENCAVWMNDIVHRGHALALHTYTHDYRQIYASPQAFLDDFARMSDFIEQSTGEKVTMFRFPGGSVNSYNKLTGKAIRDEMTRRGYTYYDWNVSSGDAANAPSAGNIYHNVIRGVHKYNTSIVLMHNSAAKRATLSQVANIIITLKNEGYRFDKLDPSVKPVNFVAQGD
ncbi:MAG TPA: polysaccharide deacetylase family protein [Oscillospiraceae bacterium]|nr:polysaccharide deacetylase family protein [Oscillospiraceae bacterium]